METTAPKRIEKQRHPNPHPPRRSKAIVCPWCFPLLAVGWRPRGTRHDDADDARWKRLRQSGLKSSGTQTHTRRAGRKRSSVHGASPCWLSVGVLAELGTTMRMTPDGNDCAKAD